MTIQTGGQFPIWSGVVFRLRAALDEPAGTFTWANALIESGEGGTIVNSGLWLITADASLIYGGGSFLIVTNTGTIRKTGGTGVSDMGPLDLINEPGGAGGGVIGDDAIAR